MYGESYRISRKRLKDDKGAKFASLKKNVIDTGLCSSCGACVASCAEKALEMVNERPKLVGKCTACGVCIHQCPKTKTTIPQLIGEYKAVYKGKTALPNVKGQDGGVVTSLLLYLLGEKLVDAAIVLQKDQEDPWKPLPSIATSEEDILKASGSIYSQGMTISALIEAIKKGYHSIAFVGTPCNIDAVTKMEESPYGMVRLFMRAKVFKIGLFCMDAFNYDRLREWVEEDKKIDIEKVEKMAISKGKFIVTTSDAPEGEEAVSVRLHDMDHLRASSCYYCVDLTSENADISVGSVGAPDGYNSIIVRTGLGMEILQEAVENGFIELEPLSRKQLKPVLTLANMKKVQLYTINRRRSYILQSSEELAAEAKPLPVQELIEETVSQPERKMVRIIKQELVSDQRHLRITVKNTTGKVLERVKIRIASLTGGLFEASSWETVIREWFPSEALEFEFPRQGEDTEYIFSAKDDKGKILTKKLDIKRFKISN